MSDIEKKRLYWACRRGMWELDLLLIPFFKHCFDTLTPNQQKQFTALLNLPDPQIYAWLMGQDEVEQKYLTIIKMIKDYAKTHPYDTNL
ncbi:MAG: succinate dehydrogenase assembly factor 2 [Pseudomonadota bacterium]